MGNASRDDAEPRPRRRIPWWAWPLLFLAILIAGWVTWNLSMDAAIEAELQAIRDAGYPAMPHEADDWYPQPEGRNAADLYSQAGRLLIDVDEADEDVLPIAGAAPRPEITQPLPAETLAAIDRHVAANAAALAKLHEAASIAESRYPVDLSLGINASLPHLGPLRDSLNLLCLEAMARAERGDIDGAIRSLDAAAGVPRSLHQEPIVISHLVVLSMNARLCRQVEYLINRRQVSDEQIGRLRSIVLKAWHDAGLERAMAGERATFHPHLADAEGFRNQMPELKAYAMAGLAKRDQLLFLELMGEYIEAAVAPPADPRALAAATTLKAEDVPRTYVAARHLLPAFGRVFEVHHWARFESRAALLSLAIVRHRHATGSVPAALADLVPDYLDAVPVDAFTGQPTEYERAGEAGFILFTPGESGRPIPAKGDPARLEFIRQLPDHFKFEYRVPADHPARKPTDVEQQ